LERNPEGLGNWKFGSGGQGSGGSAGFGIVPKNRSQFPTLIDATLARLMVTFPTSSGKILHIGFDDLTIVASAEHAPMALKGKGTYEGVPVVLAGTAQSAEIMRDRFRPYGVDLTLKAADTTLHLQATLTEPLDFDGVRGILALDARTLDDLAKAGGLSTPLS